VSGRGVAATAVVLLLLWFLFIREPPEYGSSPPSTTAPPAHVVNPAVLLDRCIGFPYPDDWRPEDEEIYVRITDVEVRPCNDDLDYQVVEVSTPLKGCDILADLKMNLLAATLGDPFDYALCLKWWRPGSS
jgi:hypothetical protein